jgi:hypothetical protein
MFDIMKLIPLTQGKFAQVDDWNYDWLMQWKWYAHKEGKKYYAVRHSKRDIDGKQIDHRMHRVIMHTPDHLKVDHEDRNPLNCREYNMRDCTRAQNNRNKSAYGKSRYVGVSFQNQKRPSGKIDTYITANIYHDKIVYRLGIFPTEELAAETYDKKALELFGEFANLNFPEKIEEYKLLISNIYENETIPI